VRANLRESMQDRSKRDAIRRLGDLDDVAADYRAAAGRGERPFRPDSGVRAVVCTFLVLLVVDLVRIPTFNMVDTFDAHTGKQQWQWSVRYLWQFDGDIRTSTLCQGSVFGTAFLIFGVIAFVTWSRAWRLLRR
jgi:hypothetical protein